MQLKCKAVDKKGVCGKVLTSSKETPEAAFKDLLVQLELHIKGRHSTQLEEYKTDLKDMQQALNVLPGWMLINAFVEIESGETSQEFKDGYEILDNLLEPLAEIFEIDDEEDEIEEEEHEKNAIELAPEDVDAELLASIDVTSDAK